MCFLKTFGILKHDVWMDIQYYPLQIVPVFKYVESCFENVKWIPRCQVGGTLAGVKCLYLGLGVDGKHIDIKEGLLWEVGFFWFRIGITYESGNEFPHFINEEVGYLIVNMKVRLFLRRLFCAFYEILQWVS